MANKKKSVAESSNIDRVKWGTKQFNKFIYVHIDGILLDKRQENELGKTNQTYIKKEMVNIDLHFTNDQMKHK